MIGLSGYLATGRDFIVNYSQSLVHEKLLSARRWRMLFSFVACKSASRLAQHVETHVALHVSLHVVTSYIISG